MFKSYVTGFVLSVLLTLAAFFVVIRPGFFGFGTTAVVITIITLAIAQFVIQLFFFLHIGKESGPRWNLGVFLSTLGVVLIVVVGAIWIMYHLNYNMSPAQMEEQLKDQGAF